MEAFNKQEEKRRESRKVKHGNRIHPMQNLGEATVMKKLFFFTGIFLFVSSASMVNADDWLLTVDIPGSSGEKPSGVYSSEDRCQRAEKILAFELRFKLWGLQKRDPGILSHRCIRLTAKNDPPSASSPEPRCLIGLGYGDVVTRAVRPGESYRLAPGERVIGLVKDNLSPCLQSSGNAATTETPPAPGLTGSSREQIYKWQDEKGQWHFSHQPPNPDKR